jgi:biotin operon repressor BirA-like protein
MEPRQTPTKLSAAALRILDALGAHKVPPRAPFSGAELSTQLEVSRTQIWKHVEQLRARGYQIEGAAGGGYQLKTLPDRLYPELIRAGLHTKSLGQHIEHFERADSTNRIAAELARQGAAHGTIVVAEEQTAGRGRLGRLEEVFDQHLDQGFEALRPRFERRFHMQGKAVNIDEIAGKRYSGTVLGIDDDGALRLAREDGSICRVLAGDVTLAPAGST